MIALAMAYFIHQRDPRYDFLDDYLSPYSPELVAGDTGISVDKIRSLAEEFHQNSSLAIAGGTWNSSEQATATQVAVFTLNAVANNLGKTLRFYESEQASEDTSHSQILQLLSDLNAGKIKRVHEGDDVRALPGGHSVAKARSNRAAVKDKSDRATVEQVLDPRTRMVLFKVRAHIAPTRASASLALSAAASFARTRARCGMTTQQFA